MEDTALVTSPGKSSGAGHDADTFARLMERSQAGRLA
jgi:hypothetical protein